MAWEAERLIDRRFGRGIRRWWVYLISHLGAALFGAALTLAVVILIRKI